MSDIEERLRAALRARGRDFTVSPDAWQRTLARRGDATTHISVARRGWRHVMTPFAAAAVVVAAVVISLVLRSVVLSGGAPSSDASVPAQPSVPASPAPYYVCTTPPAPPPAVKLAAPPAVTVVPLASVPDEAKHYATHGAAPYSAIVHVNEDLGGTVFSAYVWFAHMSVMRGAQHATQDVIFSAESYTTPADRKPAGYGYQYEEVSSLSSGHVVSAADDGSQFFPNNTSDMMRFNIASSQVATVTLTQKDDPPIPGAVLTAAGFPDKVWMMVFPKVPDWPSTLTFRDAAGNVLASGPWTGDDRDGLGCTFIAAINGYEPPQDGHAYSSGLSLPEITSVTAVLPDGQQASGTISKLAGNDYRGWQVTYPMADANLTVKLVFRNAAGQVLGTLTTVPGKNPLPSPPKPWW